jgi:hypothetical protein
VTATNNRRGQRPAQGPSRPRREPLFPLEDDDIAPSARRGPPAPLRDLVGDLDDALPSSRPMPRRDQPQRQAAEYAPSGRAGSADRPYPAERGRAEASAERAPRQETSQRAPARQQVATQERQRPQELRATPMEPLFDRRTDALDMARSRYDSIDADMARLSYESARPHLGLPMPPASLTGIGLRNLAVMGAVVLFSLLVLVKLGFGGGGSVSSRWSLPGSSAAEGAPLLAAAAARPAGDYALQGPPSVTAEQIDRILESYGSPALGSGKDWYNLGLQYGIDPAFAVAFFIHESSAGTNPNWAGIKPGGGTTHNVGNIICAGYGTCYGRFRDYASWYDGINDWYRLIDVEYLQGRGHRTVADIIPVYAPSFENDVQGYVNSVNGLVDQWRTSGVQ